MLKKIKTVFLIFFALFLLININVYAEDITLTLRNEEKEMYLNEQAYVGANVTPYDTEITYTSSDTNIATVDSNGQITSKNVGTTTITVKAGDKTATCKVTVKYKDLSIDYSKNLVMSEHESETIGYTVSDGKGENVTNPVITWKSSDTSVATVDNSGKIQAVKAGTTTITATAGGQTAECLVTVGKAPEFTDFSKAKYELSYENSVSVEVKLKISGITLKNEEEKSYYYIITSDKTKPEIKLTEHGSVDVLNSENLEGLNANSEEKYLYTAGNLNEYVELNQDLYLWVIENINLETSYTNSENKTIISSNKFVVEGEKLTRPELPQLNVIIKSFKMLDSSEISLNYINFKFPSATENRKFTIKIGKVTDMGILNKIKDNDYSGITELLSYAKTNKEIFSNTLTTTEVNYYKGNGLFDPNKLEDDTYYYIYVCFDNENGKYYPVEGVTLGQAIRLDSTNSYDLAAYNDEKFEWKNLTDTSTIISQEENKQEAKDETVANTVLPNTGTTFVIIMIVSAILVIVGAVSYKKYKFLNVEK